MASATMTPGVLQTAIPAKKTSANILTDLKNRADGLPQGWNEDGTLSWQEFLSRPGHEDLLLVDIRDDVAHENVPGAIHIPMGTFMSQMFKHELVDEDEEILVFCNTDNRSGMALFLLRLLGYANVRKIDGGYQEFQRMKDCE